MRKRLSSLFVVLVLILAACGTTEGTAAIPTEAEPSTTATQPAPTTTLKTTTTTTTTEPATTTTSEATTTTLNSTGDGDYSDQSLTIMPIGDSITSGKTGWSTYRCYLDEMLNGSGISFDFVGTQSAPYGGEPYGCSAVFDQDHEGWWGATVGGVTEGVTATVKERQPDVALIHLGVNDLFYGQGPASTAAELESFITGLQEVKPDITILVAQIIPCASLQPYCSDDLPALNDTIASFASLSTDQSSVIVVDMETDFSLGDLRDKWHPTDAGDELIASRWMASLQEAGVLGAAG